MTAEQELVTELRPNEKLLWSGHSVAAMELHTADLYIIPLGILLLSYPVFWMWRVHNISLSATILGIPFLLIGLYLTAGRFFYSAQQRAHTTYAITDERVIIRSGIFRKRVTSLNLRALPALSLSEKADETGTIFLGITPSRRTELANLYWPGLPLPPQLTHIQAARQVYNLLLQLQAPNSVRGTSQVH